MTLKGHRQINRQVAKSKHDSHCWRFYFKKYGVDYTKLNRERVNDSPVKIKEEHNG